jgi:transposase
MNSPAMTGRYLGKKAMSSDPAAISPRQAASTRRLRREVLYRSFANRRQLASYVGITPMPYQSGGMDRDRSISRAGNPRARTTLIQLAWLWLHYQPGSALAAWFRQRVGTLQRRTRRIAIVAMARKLLIALWRYVENGVLPEGIEIRAAPVATA